MAETAAPGRTRRSRVWYQFARAVLTNACRLVWRVRVHGAERLPQDGAYVIAPVHRSFIDTFLCGCLTRRRLRFVGKDTMWRYGWSAPVMSSLGGIPVHRGMPDRESLRACEDAVRAGEPVVLFPEGARQSGPVVQPLFEGAVFVAARTGVPIVPVGIGGSEAAFPKGSKRIRAVRIAMVVGEPIPPPVSAEGSGRVPRRVVRETTDRLHTEVQRLFDEACELAGQPNPPAGEVRPSGGAATA